MNLSRLIRPRLIALVGLGAIVAVAASGFAASNTVPATTSGDGSANVSGYTITNVKYGLNSTDPSKIDQLTFTLSPAAATTVTVKLAGSWYSCTNAAGAATCATTSPAATVASAATLQIVATN